MVFNLFETCKRMTQKLGEKKTPKMSILARVLLWRLETANLYEINEFWALSSR